MAADTPTRLKHFVYELEPEWRHGTPDTFSVLKGWTSHVGFVTLLVDVMINMSAAAVVADTSWPSSFTERMLQLPSKLNIRPPRVSAVSC